MYKSRESTKGYYTSNQSVVHCKAHLNRIWVWIYRYFFIVHFEVLSKIIETTNFLFCNDYVALNKLLFIRNDKILHCVLKYHSDNNLFHLKYTQIWSYKWYWWL